MRILPYIFRAIFILAVTFVVVLGNYNITLIDDEEYKMRKNEILSLVENGIEATIVDAFNGRPIDMELIENNLLLDIDQDRDAAFRIFVLVRVHQLSRDETVKKHIFDGLKTVPFWISYQEATRVYWTENQMR
jgi:hypothetical protein